MKKYLAFGALVALRNISNANSASAFKGSQLFKCRDSVLVSGLLATSLIGAIWADQSHAHSYDSMPGSHAQTPLKPIAEFLADVADRPRRVIYTPYPVSARHGLVQGFVHVTDGSAVLTRSDLVVDSLMPIVVRRAYYSSREHSAEFGIGGWRLTAVESIRVDRKGTFAYMYGNGNTLHFDSRGRIQSPLDSYLTDVMQIKFESDADISILCRTGIAKHFTQHGSVYLLRRVSDSFGNGLTLEYDAHGRLKAIMSADGKWVELARDRTGRVIAAMDNERRLVRYGYDDAGRLATVTDLGEQVWEYKYDSANRLIATITPNGETDTRFQFDNMDRVKVSYANDLETSYQYSRPTTIVTDHLGRKLKFVSAASGVTARVTNVYGNTSELEFDREGLPIALTRNGQLVAKLTSETPRGGISAKINLFRNGTQVSHTIMFDSIGRVIEVQDLVGIEGGFRVEAYNSGLTPGRVAYSDGTTEEITLDSRGELANVQLRDGGNWQFEITGADWKIGTETGQFALFRFDRLGRLEEVETPNGPTLTFQYGNVGLRESLASSDGARVHYWYDASGSLFYSAAGYVSSGMKSHTYATGAGHRVESIKGSAGDTHVFEYYQNGLLKAFVSPFFADPSFYYDDIGRLIRVEFEGHKPLTHDYAPGEVDVVSQLTVRATPTFNQQREHTDFGSRFDVGMSRVQPSASGVFTYNETLQEVVVATDPSRWMPTSHVGGTLRAFRLKHLFEESGPNLAEFTMPSNRLFVPREYWSVNCCFCYCEGHDFECQPQVPQ